MLCYIMSESSSEKSPQNGAEESPGSARRRNTRKYGPCASRTGGGYAQPHSDREPGKTLMEGPRTSATAEGATMVAERGFGFGSGFYPGLPTEHGRDPESESEQSEYLTGTDDRVSRSSSEGRATTRLKSVVVPVTSRGPARSPVLLPGGHRRVTTAVVHAGRGNSSSDSETDGDSGGARGGYGSRSSGRSRPVCRRARTRRDSTTAGTKRRPPKKGQNKASKETRNSPEFRHCDSGESPSSTDSDQNGSSPETDRYKGARGSSGLSTRGSRVASAGYDSRRRCRDGDLDTGMRRTGQGASSNRDGKDSGRKDQRSKTRHRRIEIRSSVTEGESEDFHRREKATELGTHPPWVFPTKVAEITEENGSIVHMKTV